jgi:hypothetical protein
MAGVPAGAAAPAPLAATNEQPATSTNAPAGAAVRSANNSTGNVSTGTHSITGCTRINSIGTHEVQTFSADVPDGCIEINASFVTLEGAGVGATLTGGGDGHAIEVVADSAIVTIENIDVEDWETGVDAQYVDFVTVSGLEARNVKWGVDVYGATDAVVSNTEVYGASEHGIDGRTTTSLDVDDLEVWNADTAIETDGFNVPDDVDVDNVQARNIRETALRVGDDGSTIDVDGLSVTNATSGVDVTGRPTGTVTNVTVQETPVAVAAFDDASALRFEDVDLAAEPFGFTGTAAEATFNVSNASVGTVQSAPSPRIPDGQTNGTGPVRVVPNGGPTEFVVDYDPVVAEPFEGTVAAWAYDRGSWDGPAGTTHGANETVRFTPTGETTLGVFYQQSPVSACAEFDAPGDYEVESISEFTATDCLRVTHDDVTLSGTGGGSEVSGPGGDAVVIETGVDDAVVENLTFAGWTRGVNASGATEATVRDVTVDGAGGTAVEARSTERITVESVSVVNLTDGGTGLDIYSAEDVTVDGLGVTRPQAPVTTIGHEDRDAGVATNAVDPASYTAIAAGGLGTVQTLNVRDVVVRNATRGVFVDTFPTSVVGTVANVTARDVREVVNVDGSRADTLQFDRIDTGTATASFTVLDAIVGPATKAVTPSTPGITGNATGHLNVTGDRAGSYVEVDYGRNVPEVYEDSVFTARYDEATTQWASNGTQDAANETVRFRPYSTSELVGVFAEQPPLTSCGVLDAPGVYEVDSFAGPVDDSLACLRIDASDVTLRGTPGATVTGNGSGTGVAIVDRWTDHENVSVRRLAVEQYEIGLLADETAASVTVDDARVADSEFGILVREGDATIRNTTTDNTTAYAIQVTRPGDVLLRDVTVLRPEGIGVSVGVADRLTIDGLTVEDAAAADTVSGSPIPGTGLRVGGNSDTDVRDVAVRNATRGLWLGFQSVGTIRGVSTTDVDNAIYTQRNNSRLTVRNLATAEGRATVVGPENVSVSPSAVAGTPTDRPVRLGVVNVTGTTDSARTALVFEFDPAAVEASDLAVYQYDPATGQWSAVTGPGAVDEANGTVTASNPPIGNGSTSVYGAFSTAIDTTDPVGEAGPDRRVQPGEAVTFDGSGSTDDTGIAAYTWSFGDGATTAPRAIPTVTHSYASEGTYRVDLTVADGAGNVDTDSLTVTVGPACPVVDGVRTTDTTGDGLCNDVDGNAKFEFFDVVALLFVDGSSLTNAEKATFDFDGDGRFGFLDVVTLLFEL